MHHEAPVEINLERHYQILKKVVEFKKTINEISKGHLIRICILGTHEDAQNLYYALFKRLIPVYCFCKVETVEKNSKLCGRPVISLQELEKDKETFLVIDAVSESSSVSVDHSNISLPYVVSNNEIIALMVNVPEIEWFSSLRKLAVGGDTQQEQLVLIDRLNQEIFDLCYGYMKMTEF